MKDHRGDESKAKASVPTSTQNSEPSDKARKDKKKKQHKAKRDSTPATGVNKAEVGDHRAKKDISEISCYNCNKKGHYLNKCLECKRCCLEASQLITSHYYLERKGKCST